MPPPEFAKLSVTGFVKDSKVACQDLLMRWLSGKLRGRKTTLLCSYPRTLSVSCYVNRSDLINTMHIISEMKIQMPACVNYISGAIYVSAMNVNCPLAPISPRCLSEWQSEATGQLERSIRVSLTSVPQTSPAAMWMPDSELPELRLVKVETIKANCRVSQWDFLI